MVVSPLPRQLDSCLQAFLGEARTGSFALFLYRFYVVATMQRRGACLGVASMYLDLEWDHHTGHWYLKTFQNKYAEYYQDCLRTCIFQRLWYTAITLHTEEDMPPVSTNHEHHTHETYSFESLTCCHRGTWPNRHLRIFSAHETIRHMSSSETVQVHAAMPTLHLQDMQTILKIECQIKLSRHH